MTFFNRAPTAWRSCLLATLLSLATAAALAHGMSESDKDFLQGSTGVQILSFLYLGAKHMVTGYDHLLFLCGVIFFLYRMKNSHTLDAQRVPHILEYPALGAGPLSR